MDLTASVWQHSLLSHLPDRTVISAQANTVQKGIYLYAGLL